LGLSLALTQAEVAKMLEALEEKAENDHRGLSPSDVAIMPRDLAVPISKGNAAFVHKKTRRALLSKLKQARKLCGLDGLGKGFLPQRHFEAAYRSRRKIRSQGSSSTIIDKQQAEVAETPAALEENDHRGPSDVAIMPAALEEKAENDHRGPSDVAIMPAALEENDHRGLSPSDVAIMPAILLCLYRREHSSIRRRAVPFSPS
jgi:hypothetical protein